MGKNYVIKGLGKDETTAIYYNHFNFIYFLSELLFILIIKK